MQRTLRLLLSVLAAVNTKKTKLLKLNEDNRRGFAPASSDSRQECSHRGDRLAFVDGEDPPILDHLPAVHPHVADVTPLHRVDEMGNGVV